MIVTSDARYFLNDVLFLFNFLIFVWIDNWRHDIALIKLEEDLPLDTDTDIGAVSLPDSHNTTFPADSAVCIMKGWGCTSNGKNSAKGFQIYYTLTVHLA